LDDYVQTHAAMQSGNMVRCNGVSGHPGVKLGGSVSVQSSNALNISSASHEALGSYTVITVNHHCDGQGNYSNEFVSIPSTVKMPPVKIYAEPHCETQSAFVTDNHDPDGFGRIRVRYYWMTDSEKTPWLRITSPHGGSEKGFFFIPEVNEEVIVGFEGDSATKPFIVGTVYHNKAKTGFGNQDNDIKTIQTRSGNKVVMNDKEGSVFVEDKDSNSIKIDGAGNINVTAKETIVLACGDAKIEMKKDGTINLTGKNITINAQQSAKMVSGQASFAADGNSGDAKMDGMNANINGSMGAKVAGGAKTDITASGNVAVKGALITLN
jgi:type VI secretion system secreted protein VgrG